jgi:ketosteroid isomerase-like protein
MSEEPRTSNLVELTRDAFDAVNRDDLDTLMGFYAADAVFDLFAAGIGTFAAVDSIRGFVEDWWKTWGDHVAEVGERATIKTQADYLAVAEPRAAAERLAEERG